MGNIEYEVDTKILSDCIQQLLDLHMSFPSTAFSTVESEKEIGATHSKILEQVAEIKTAQEQLKTLILTTMDYLKGINDAVIQGDSGNLE